MTIECPKCQTNNPDSQKFCGECATPLPHEKEITESFTKTLETPTEELTTGSTFAERYQIIEELGKGGMGRVYKVLDKETKEKIALKLIKPEIASDKKTIERFRNELTTARKIGHRNVCRMYDLNRDKDNYYITMEYVSGGDLKRFIRRVGQLPSGKAISIAKQICEGLAEAHSLGVVHRDLKPSNIIIDDNGNARIMDFGIARTVKGKGITGSGVMIGTPEYMSPEQAEAKEVDQKSDIYSLGVILYEMSTGRLPFEGDTPLSVAMKHKGESPKDPKEFNPQIPDNLSKVILKCLEKEKESRYQTADDVRSELERIEQGLPTTDRVALKKKPLTSKEITVTFGMKKWLVPVLVVFVLAVIGLLVWSPWAKKDSIPTSSDKLSLAVVYFTNNTGDDNLDHWRSALPQWLITDLTQSKYIKMLGGDQLLNVLRKLNLVEARSYDRRDLINIAREGSINHILHASLSKAGDLFRIDYTLQNMITGESIGTDYVLGQGEESFPAMVDELTKKVKENFKLSAEQIVGDIDKQIGKITTTSPEAFMYYSQGREFLIKLEYEKSIRLMEKAVDLDPGFALAYRSLGVAYGNLGNRTKKKEYIQRAFELSDRISERERYLIQGDYYRGSEKTYGEAIEAYSKLLELYPDHIQGNTNLRGLNRDIEEWDKAIERFEANKKRKVTTYIPYMNLARVYEAKGLYDKARELLEDYAKNFSELPNLRKRVSRTYISQGEFDLALNEANKAFSLTPLDYSVNVLYGEIYQLKGDFKEADKEFRKLADTSNENDLRSRMRSLSYLYLTEGKFRESKEQIQKGLELSIKASDASSEASFHSYLYRIFLTSGEFSSALKEAEAMWDYALETDIYDARRVALWQKGLAYVGMNSIEKAQETADELKEFIEKGIYKKAIRFYHHLQGGIELKKNNFSQAIEYLNKTVSSLHAQNYYSYYDALFYDTLALAYLKAGDLEKAQKNYEAIISMTWGRLRWGNIYTNAFYMLGKIYERQASKAKAIEHYEKFLSLWKDADPGLPEVEDAQKRLAGLKE